MRDSENRGSVPFRSDSNGAGASAAASAAAAAPQRPKLLKLAGFSARAGSAHKSNYETQYSDYKYHYGDDFSAADEYYKYSKAMDIFAERGQVKPAHRSEDTLFPGPLGLKQIYRKYGTPLLRYYYEYQYREYEEERAKQAAKKEQEQKSNRNFIDEAYVQNAIRHAQDYIGQGYGMYFEGDSKKHAKKLEKGISSLFYNPNQPNKYRKRTQFIVVSVKSVKLYKLGISCIELCDKDATISAQVLRETIGEFPTILTPGTTLLLCGCTIFWPSVDNPYLIIAPKNLILAEPPHIERLAGYQYQYQQDAKPEADATNAAGKVEARSSGYYSPPYQPPVHYHYYPYQQYYYKLEQETQLSGAQQYAGGYPAVAAQQPYDQPANFPSYSALPIPYQQYPYGEYKLQQEDLLSGAQYAQYPLWPYDSAAYFPSDLMQGYAQYAYQPISNAILLQPRVYSRPRPLVGYKRPRSEYEAEEYQQQQPFQGFEAAAAAVPAYVPQYQGLFQPHPEFDDQAQYKWQYDVNSGVDFALQQYYGAFAQPGAAAGIEYAQYEQQSYAAAYGYQDTYMQWYHYYQDQVYAQDAAMQQHHMYQDQALGSYGMVQGHAPIQVEAEQPHHYIQEGVLQDVQHQAYHDHVAGVGEQDEGLWADPSLFPSRAGSPGSPAREAPLQEDAIIQASVSSAGYPSSVPSDHAANDSTALQAPVSPIQASKPPTPVAVVAVAPAAPAPQEVFAANWDALSQSSTTSTATNASAVSTSSATSSVKELLLKKMQASRQQLADRAKKIETRPPTPFAFNAPQPSLSAPSQTSEASSDTDLLF